MEGPVKSKKEYDYTVLFEPAAEGGCVVTCPALPGLVTEGDTLEDIFEHYLAQSEQLPSFVRLHADGRHRGVEAIGPRRRGAFPYIQR